MDECKSRLLELERIDESKEIARYTFCFLLFCSLSHSPPRHEKQKHLLETKDFIAQGRNNSTSSYVAEIEPYVLVTELANLSLKGSVSPEKLAPFWAGIGQPQSGSIPRPHLLFVERSSSADGKLDAFLNLSAMVIDTKDVGEFRWLSLVQKKHQPMCSKISFLSFPYVAFSSKVTFYYPGAAWKDVGEFYAVFRSGASLPHMWDLLKMFGKGCVPVTPTTGFFKVYSFCLSDATRRYDSVFFPMFMLGSSYICRNDFETFLSSKGTEAELVYPSQFVALVPSSLSLKGIRFDDKEYCSWRIKFEANIIPTEDQLNQICHFAQTDTAVRVNSFQSPDLDLAGRHNERNIQARRQNLLEEKLNLKIRIMARCSFVKCTKFRDLVEVWYEPSGKGSQLTCIHCKHFCRS